MLAVGSAPAVGQDEGASSDQIIVTGSRIKRDGFDSPTPATVMSADLIQGLGQTNVSETLRLIPQISLFQSDSTAGITAGANVGAFYANLRGLNPYNGTRTLTLVNTRRFIPTSDGGAVDLNIIPSSMIERVETVTGGASAAYGSDAVAGVVNIILDTDFEGFRGQVDYGQTARGDGETYHAALTFGSGFAGGRGHVVIGGEFEKKEGIGDCYESRLWCAEGWDRFTNASNILLDGTVSGYNLPGTPDYGLPNFVIGPDSRQAFNDPHGVVRNRDPADPDARNHRFNDDGTGIIEFDPGRFVSTSTFGPRQGGDGASTYADSDLQTPTERYVGYLYSEYELTDSLNLVGEFTYANRQASNTGVTAGPRSTFFVKPTNAYLPAELVTLLDGTSFSLGKDIDAQVPSYNEATTEVFRGVIGANGEFGDSWSWDVYYQYGKNDRHQSRTNSRVNTPFVYALDAVVDPMTNEIVCAELLEADPDPVAEGCVPLNLFGLDNLDPAAVAYAYRPVVEDFKYDQHVIAGSIQGVVYDGWGAGPIGVAAGGEYRDEGGDVTHGDIPNYNDYAFTFGLDYAGDISVLEGFFEMNIPVLRDVALADYLEINGAVRQTRNHATDRLTKEEKTSNATSWKVSTIYDITEGLRFRASRSRDIRAAGFRELYLKNVPTEEGSSQGIVDNPAIPGSPGGGGDDPTPILGGGAFSLTPEKADTTTAGFVVSPGFVPGLTFSADWYQIKIKDVVSTLTGQGIVNFCEDYNLFCGRITYASPTDITFVDARQVNLGQLTVRGFDFELDYNLPLENLHDGLAGDLNFRVLANHQYDFVVLPDPTVDAIDYAGQSGPIRDGGDFNPSPKWIWNGFISYNYGGFNTTVTVRRIGSGIYGVEYTGPEDAGYDPSLPNSISTNRVDAATYVNLAMSYEIKTGSGGQNVEVFGAIDNLFDKKPPVAPGGGGLGGSNYPTNPVYFDTFGMRFKTGVRIRF
ncbi:TonB-dependent receptor [Marinicaulis flavus]|uniref:TonB-dependent receptor n=2 Tax=Hyphococcus luteus TaxID=2058213 RepID=A0A2S7K2A3_9PROT|nr:TonB-dependent receptor [Marinicaulis flavus]